MTCHAANLRLLIPSLDITLLIVLAMVMIGVIGANFFMTSSIYITEPQLR